MLLVASFLLALSVTFLLYYNPYRQALACDQLCSFLWLYHSVVQVARPSSKPNHVQDTFQTCGVEDIEHIWILEDAFKFLLDM